jgi:predicted dienelactone hydrolase
MKSREAQVRLRFTLLFAFLCSGNALAAVGLTQIAGLEGDGPVTVFYPTGTEARELRRGPFALQVAEDGVPGRGNGRLVILSHGSGGNPWVHSNLARALVEAGFVAAFPEHRGDNFRDPSRPGPESWKRRPAEVSRAIDAVARDARFAPLLGLDRVGVYGMSAGGHTALTLAGGRWSPASFRRHCEKHLDEDFPACVGLATSLSGGWMDTFKKWTARWVLAWRFTDAAWQTHRDARVKAIVAAVPYAADFDMGSLASPAAPLGLVNAGKDKWLAPRFHGEAVLKACKACVRVADLPTGGHGALLSPLPPGLTGTIGALLNDPPGFDRKLLPPVDRRIADFFRQHLLP